MNLLSVGAIVKHKKTGKILLRIIGLVEWNDQQDWEANLYCFKDIETHTIHEYYGYEVILLLDCDEYIFTDKTKYDTFTRPKRYKQLNIFGDDNI